MITVVSVQFLTSFDCHECSSTDKCCFFLRSNCGWRFNTFNTKYGSNKRRCTTPRVLFVRIQTTNGRVQRREWTGECERSEDVSRRKNTTKEKKPWPCSPTGWEGQKSVQVAPPSSLGEMGVGIGKPPLPGGPSTLGAFRSTSGVAFSPRLVPRSGVRLPLLSLPGLFSLPGIGFLHWSPRSLIGELSLSREFYVPSLFFYFLQH